jgi:hypothetical protein
MRNKTARTKYLKDYFQAHKEENKKRLRKKARSVSGRYRSAKASAASRKFTFDLTLEEYAQIIQENVCFYCLGPLNETGSGLDRKDNEPFYSKENCVPCCWPCNITFNSIYTFGEKLMLAKTIREIYSLRKQRKLDSHTTVELPLLN